MRIWTSLLIAAPVAVGLLAAPAAHADWHNNHGGGWHGGNNYHNGGYHGGGYYHGGGNGNAVAGALVGLGVGALIGGAIASQAYAPPPVAYAPAPAYYPPPTYSYYGQPGYYQPGY